MANAIKKISLQRGYDVSEYTLCCFGGAGGQHACLIADALGITKVFIHPYSGVLSAYGMGLADVRVLKEKAIEAVLELELLSDLQAVFTELAAQGKQELNRQDANHPQINLYQKLLLRYEGTDAPLVVDFANLPTMQNQFAELHRLRYGFIASEKRLIVEAATVELVLHHHTHSETEFSRINDNLPVAETTVQMYMAGKWWDTPVYRRENLQPGDCISGPAIIVEATGTNIIEPHWQAELTNLQNLILNRTVIQNPKSQIQNRKDAVMLEIFNNLFRAIAEQMGITLQNTSSSVNIKERLDFSCAIFDHHGQLVANAPHIPVHLGSMSESVQALISTHQNNIQPGDVFAANNPYNGGTHLPDITVITPVFLNSQLPIFYVASRGHHADIGGITPGSMPPHSTSITEEGILLDNFQLVKAGIFCEQELINILSSEPYPARNITQNIADLKAQIAANELGVKELLKLVEHYSLETVKAYMGFVQDNAELSVRRVIEVLKDGSFSYALDDGSMIKVKITIDKKLRNAKIDFTGTSPQLNNNFNAPSAVCKAAVLYVFRTLVNDDIPLNAGCMKPLEVIIPEGCMLNPCYPAAVVAGNVETSQAITDALYGALSVLAAAQGTMNNFTFGNEKYQYYETICGGSGAGADFDGTDAVHTHMTNSRLTDPEVLEWRFPVILENFAIREHSGGKGKFHGGNGVIRRLRFLENMTAGILANHRIIPPFGLSGGEAGMVGKNYVERNNGTVEELGSKGVVEMNPEDIFVIETPGGGGYGEI